MARTATNNKKHSSSMRQAPRKAVTTSSDALSVSTAGNRTRGTDSLSHQLKPKTKKTLAHQLQLVLENVMEHSSFFQKYPGRQVPSFDNSEIRIGALLGTGEFGVVHCVEQLAVAEAEAGKVPSTTSTTLVPSANSGDSYYEATHEGAPLQSILIPDESLLQDDDKDDHLSLDDDDSTTGSPQPLPTIETTRKLMSEHCIRDGMARYAMKKQHFLANNNSNKPSSVYSDDHVINAAIDLACEAKFLASLAHSNIIRLRATVGTIGTVEFGILMDRLTDTLEDRIEKQWKEQHAASKSKWWNYLPKQQSNNARGGGGGGGGGSTLSGRQQLYADRLLAAFDIARAMRYLHAHKLIYRDLKPDNIGFDVRGNVRLFDFGLTKELKKQDLVEAPDKYDATGLTGSRRFMSPEIVKCLPYGFSADIYSFSILLWQIFSLQTPFPHINVRKHYEEVVIKHKRPNKHAAKLSPMLCNMMTSGWHHEPSQRPSFSQICQQLQVEILDVTADSAMSIVDRSTHLLNRSLKSLYNNKRMDGDDEYDDDDADFL